MNKTKSAYSSPPALPPPSKLRAVPRVPCCPTPRPRWPLLLRLLPPVGLPCSRCRSEETENRLAAPLVGEQLRDLAVSVSGWARGLSGLFQEGHPEGLLLAPLRAVFEQMLASLNLILAPPTGVEWSTQGQAVPRLDLVGKVLVGTRHRRVRLLLFTGGSWFYRASSNTSSPKPRA